MFTIRHRGQVRATVETLDQALQWLHANQPDCAKTAVTTGGYDVRDQRGKRYFGPRKRF